MIGEANTLEQVKEILSGVSRRLHWWSPNRALAKGERDTAAAALGASRKAVRGGKLLIDTDTPAWRRLVKVRGYVTSWWEYATLPYTVPGQRLFLREHREEIWSRAKEYDSELRAAGKAMDDAREEVLASAKEMLGKIYDESLYPASWEEEFSLEVREHSIDPPSYLRHTNAEEYQKELQRTVLSIGESLQRFEEQCLSEMADAATRLSANLEDGGRVMGANIENFNKLFRRVCKMRFKGTTLFREAIGDAKEIMDGVGANELRTSGGLRTQTREKLQDLIARYAYLAKNPEPHEDETVTV